MNKLILFSITSLWLGIYPVSSNANPPSAQLEVIAYCIVEGSIGYSGFDFFRDPANRNQGYLNYFDEESYGDAESFTIQYSLDGTYATAESDEAPHRHFTLGPYSPALFRINFDFMIYECRGGF